MRASDAQKSGILAWIEKWRPRLYLQHYRIVAVWRAKADRDDTDDRETRARATSDDAGLVAHIEFFPPFWRLDSEMQHRTVIHELCHVIAPNATEGEVNHLTECLWLAYEDQPCLSPKIGQTS